MKPLVTKQQEQDYRAYMLAELRCARKRAQLALNEIDRIGVGITEEFHLVPEQSTSAIVVPHPEAKYFVA